MNLTNKTIDELREVVMAYSAPMNIHAIEHGYHDEGVQAFDEVARRLREAEKDAERVEFLESLRDRRIFVNKRNPAYYKRTDIHISGPDHCSIYARTEIGSSIEFQGHGNTVREAIDAAMKELKT